MQDFLAKYEKDVSLLVTLADSKGDTAEHAKSVEQAFKSQCIKLSAILALDFATHPAILKAVRRDAITKISSQNASSKKVAWSAAGKNVQDAIIAGFRENVEVWATGEVADYNEVCKSLAEMKPVDICEVLRKMQEKHGNEAMMEAICKVFPQFAEVLQTA